MKNEYMFDCKNYRTIALMSHLGKILTMTLIERLRNQTDRYIVN